jgi:hypothetical protein
VIAGSSGEPRHSKDKYPIRENFRSPTPRSPYSVLSNALLHAARLALCFKLDYKDAFLARFPQIFLLPYFQLDRSRCLIPDSFGTLPVAID